MPQFPTWSASAVLWGALVLPAAEAAAQQPNITSAVTIPQQDVIAGKVPLRKIIESGAHFFSYPYTLPDGWGEGPDGPRAWQRKVLYPNSPFIPYAGPDGVPPPIPMLRLNGIDSQSCFECHTSIGATVLPDLTGTGTATRTQPAIGGTAGIANLAFINSQFPNPMTQLLRKPPHVFGTGYTQAIANEMTAELYAQHEALKARAKATPKMPQSAPLTAKGEPFGVLKVTYNGNGDTDFDTDTSGVTAVASDLVVRPFQWKGIASSVRHFVAAATQFHFSMEGVEVVGENVDHDGDGVINELSYGNVGALTTFVALTRPPFVETVTDPTRKAQAERGQAIFEGTAANAGIPQGSQMCASCHRPTQTLNTPVVTIEWGVKVGDPNVVGSDAGIELPSRGQPTLQVQAPVRRVIPSLVFPVERTEFLPVIRALKAAPAVAPGTVPTPVPQGLQINLNTLQSRVNATGAWNNLSGQPGIDPPANLPAYTRNRLPFQSPDQPLTVPLHSDLRLHDMGPCLTDMTSQGVDVVGISVPPQKFLTRPLWGVADAWPYLHDARARDLVHAIRFHGGTRPPALAKEFPYICKGSEADPVIDAYYQLSDPDQQALLAYLSTLRLPPLPGSVIPF